MFAEAVKSLGTEIERRFGAVHYESSMLPEIAGEELQRANLANRISYKELLQSLVASNSIKQSYDKFSDFQQTVWHGEYFQIDFLLWLNSKTGKHQHGFCGAFQVIQGSSCQSTFLFSRSKCINDRLELGEVNWLNTKILRRGDVQKICGGQEFIHSVTHLQKPSMTLLVRSVNTPQHLPQWSYYSPCVRMNPFVAPQRIDYTLTKKIRAVDVAWECDLDFGDELANQVLERCDLETAFRFMILADRPTCDGQAQKWKDAVHHRLMSRWPKFWPSLKKAVDENDRVLEVGRKRKTVSDPHQRFILEVLLTVPDRDAILDLVSAEFPNEDPREFIASKIASVDSDECPKKIEERSKRILASIDSGQNLKELL